ncbi:MAG TPA: TonB-dependent receptor [Vicinamibacterales bacterium]|nr:TonB-dependent receptor [Vicinamibacterales bacterium]
MRSSHIAATLLVILGIATPVVAQGQRGRLLVTVADTSAAVIPDAKVTLVALDEAAKGAPIPAVQTSSEGVATFTGLTPGRYSIVAEFTGFEMGLLREVSVRAGDNRRVVVLKIQGLQETVNVGQEGQAAASNRSSASFGVKLSEDQLEALSDDPEELARQLKEMAGPNAIIRVDSFEGMQLPPKSQIKSVHVTRDQFAAESPNPGDTFVEVITAPGIGPIRGGFNANVRAGGWSAKNPFAPEKGADHNQRVGLNIGGALKENKSSFSINFNHSLQYTAPTLNVVAPGGGVRVETLKLRTPAESYNIALFVDYALTRDQTLRFGYYDNDNVRRNNGVGDYDSLERAYTSKNGLRYYRIQHAGPIGRRIFINNRLFVGAFRNEAASAVEAPTIRVLDAWTTGGAQQRGSSHQVGFQHASDLDYIRGIHSWRTGVLLFGVRPTSTIETNYLGTYTFPNREAYEAGTPSLYTRFIGDPRVQYFSIEVGAYVQDDIRISKGLTISPGVRFSTQNTVRYPKAWEPRFGLTWAPTPGGKTTLRASAGIFHNFLPWGTYEQTVRVDGVRQREMVIRNPSYPDPGTEGVVPPANKYILGDYPLPENIRYSAGIDQAFSPRFKVNALYNYIRQTRMARGRNLNPLVNGVRPDPNFANIIETVTDATLLRHELFINGNVGLAPPAPALNRARWNWKRVSGTWTYQWIRARRNAVSAFDVPPTGSLDDQWGNGPGDLPYWLSVNVNSTQLRNLNVGVTWQANDGYPYMLTTGLDNNADGIINDRPAGVGVWSLRGTPQSTVSSRIAYTLTPGSPPGAPQASIRYRMVLFMNVNNLTNRANYSGFSGVETSPFFMRARSVNNPRRIDFGMNVNF